MFHSVAMLQYPSPGIICQYILRSIMSIFVFVKDKENSQDCRDLVRYPPAPASYDGDTASLVLNRGTTAGLAITIGNYPNANVRASRLCYRTTQSNLLIMLSLPGPVPMY